MSSKASYDDFLRRFEMLKRQYFAGTANQYDSEGEPMPPAIDRATIVMMFDKMNVEIPMHPNDPPKFKQSYE